MLFIIFALILGALWYVADKQLKEKFLPHIKWPGLAIIVFFIVFDVNMMLETTRFIDVKAVSDQGLLYTYTDPDTMLTTETRMYGVQTEDSGTIMAYHYTEFALWPIFTGLLPMAFYLIIGMSVLQLLLIWYDNYRGAK